MALAVHETNGGEGGGKDAWVEISNRVGSSEDQYTSGKWIPNQKSRIALTQRTPVVCIFTNRKESLLDIADLEIQSSGDDCSLLVVTFVCTESFRASSSSATGLTNKRTRAPSASACVLVLTTSILPQRVNNRLPHSRSKGVQTSLLCRRLWLHVLVATRRSAAIICAAKQYAGKEATERKHNYAPGSMLSPSTR